MDKMNTYIYGGLLGCIGILFVLSVILWKYYEVKTSEIAKLEAEKQILLQNEKTLQEAIENQNNVIRELAVKETLIDNSRLLEIQVKDDTCEAELQAYKSLFMELGK